MKFCTKCGAKIFDEDAIFCSNCGVKLVKENSQPAEPEKTEPKKSVQEIMLAAKKTAENNAIQSEYEKKKAAIKAQAEYEQKKSAIKTQSEISPPIKNYNPQPVHVTDDTFHDIFFKKEGRLNRKRFIKRILLEDILMVLVAMIFFVALEETRGEYFAAGIAGIIVLVIDTVLCYNLIIRRCHDLSSKSYWAKKIADDDEIMAKFYAAFNVLIIFGVIYVLMSGKDISAMKFTNYAGAWILYLWIAKGEIGANKFGADPLGEVRSYTSGSQNDSSKTFLIIGGIILAILVAFVAIDKNNNQNYTNTSQQNFDYSCRVDGINYKGQNNGQWGVALVEIRKDSAIYPLYINPIYSRGEFHIVTLVGTNYQNQADIFNTFELVDDNGRRFSEDINATSTYLNTIGLETYKNVNPNQTELNVLVFDIPRDVNIVKIHYENYMGYGTNAIELPYYTITE